jgi:hypothetical protein
MAGKKKKRCRCYQAGLINRRENALLRAWCILASLINLFM